MPELTHSKKAEALRFKRRARAFWASRQSAAKGAGFSGYLLDESPPGIGERRFRGEWADLRSLLAPRAGGRGRCLDLGCGTGLWMRALAGRFERVEGWDDAPSMARAARQRLRQAGIRNAVVRCGDLRRRAGKAVFDLIFVGGVLMYTPEAQLASLLRALRRLLKPGGVLVLRESCTDSDGWVREGLPLRPGLLAQKTPAVADYVAIYRSRAGLLAALQGAGFTLLQERPNRHYKLSDLTEDWLRRLNRLSRGALQGDPTRAERAAAWVYALRWILLYPEYFCRPWRLQNRWFVAVQSTRR